MSIQTTVSLFEPYQMGIFNLANRIVMAPMTRSRAINNIPGDLAAEYYSQRADAGLIVTEGTSPSPNGLGYARIPGIYSQAQIEGWRKVTEAVHKKSAKIFIQIMHTGRVTHPLNLPEGGRVIAPSPVRLGTQMYTDQQGMQDFPEPEEMTPHDILTAREEYVTAAKNAIEAGFDGIELHGANGYLLEQFIAPNTNLRTDSYGGRIENRAKFVLEVVDAVCSAIGPERVGIRFSPYGAANEIRHNEETDAMYTYLAEQLNVRHIAYIHIVDHSAMGAPPVPQTIKDSIRKHFTGTLILAGGYTRERAEEDLSLGRGDLIAFAKPFISNPDLVRRLEHGYELAPFDAATFYTPGEKGYTDYPTFS